MKRLGPAHKQLMIPFAIAIMITVLALSATNVRCQKRQHGAAAASQTTQVANPCRINEESTTCLKSRIDRLGVAISNLEERMNQLQKTSKSSGGGDGKDDSFTGIWKEINKIKDRLNMN